MQKYWTAFTDKGIEYLIKSDMSSAEIKTTLFFTTIMNEENIITIPRKTDIFKIMDQKLKTGYSTATQARTFSKLQSLNIIKKIPKNTEFTPGFMFNPFIAYNGGKAKGQLNSINWIKINNYTIKSKKYTKEYILISKETLKEIHPFDTKLFNSDFDFEGINELL